jgi:predicted flavoprotein YhiN
MELFNLKDNQKARVIRILEKITIKRLAKFIIKYLKIDETKLVANTSKKELQLIIDSLLHFSIPITKVESIGNAFVNGGGILTNQINPSTMESKIKEGLFFTGEVLDLHGPIGGFNITIALSTGYTAANNIRRD